jgi:hypothetical protein
MIPAKRTRSDDVMDVLSVVLSCLIIFTFVIPVIPAAVLIILAL